MVAKAAGVKKIPLTGPPVEKKKLIKNISNQGSGLLLFHLPSSIKYQISKLKIAQVKNLLITPHLIKPFSNLQSVAERASAAMQNFDNEEPATKKSRRR